MAFEVRPLAPIATTFIVALALFSKSIEIFGSVVVKTIGFPISGAKKELKNWTLKGNFLFVNHEGLPEDVDLGCKVDACLAECKH